RVFVVIGGELMAVQLVFQQRPARVELGDGNRGCGKGQEPGEKRESNQAAGRPCAHLSPGMRSPGGVCARYGRESKFLNSRWFADSHLRGFPQSRALAMDEPEVARI